MKEEKEEENYVGNIWGWKYSYYALYIILFALVLALSRYAYLKYTGQYPVEYQKEELIKNNTHIENQE